MPSQLQNLLFSDRKARWNMYAWIVAACVLYGLFNDLVLGRSEKIVSYEVLVFCVFGNLVGWVGYSLRQRHSLQFRSRRNWKTFEEFYARVRLIRGFYPGLGPIILVLTSFMGFLGLYAKTRTPTHTGTEALAIILSWIHLLAGITWIGLLYFFNLVNVPFMKQVDAGTKPKVFQYMTLPALQWFRWSALLTVFVGFWYWVQIYVAADAQRMGVSPLSTIGLFLLIWIVTWGILYFVILKTPSGYVLGAITTVLVILAGWLFVNYTPVGQDDNRVLSIGIGTGFGIVMLLNAWGIIWRNQKAIIQGTLAGTPPANAATLARQAFLASRITFFLSGPMLLLVAASYTIKN